jgi:hypothetical protein
MKKILAHLKRPLLFAVTLASLSAFLIVAGPVASSSGGLTGSVAPMPKATSTTTDASTTTTSTVSTSTTTTSSNPVVPGGLIAAGPSRSECIDPNFNDTGLASIKNAVGTFDSETHSTVTCLSAYLNGEPSWTTWEHPWIIQPQYGYTAWVAEKPQQRQLVLQVDLIPSDLSDVGNPLNWERSCAAGDYEEYATQLGESLVGVGLQNSVIRLGPEMNGIWEADFVGTTSFEQHLWGECFASEVTGLRAATGEHFLIDWNPNACVENIPLGNFYPGNAYVDIVGLDLFDVSCVLPRTRRTFAELADETAGLASFESFATARGKPMSLPEWGLEAYPSGDDPGYIDGIGATFRRRDFAFESYFDVNLKIRPYLGLGPNSPRALKAFQKWFGNRS